MDEKEPLMSDSGLDVLDEESSSKPSYYKGSRTSISLLPLSILIGCVLLLACIAIAVIVVIFILVFVVFKEPKGMPPFGRKMKEQMFSLDMDAYILNHGSYGAAPLPVQESCYEYFGEMNRNTMRWFNGQLKPLLVSVRQALAEYINSDEEDVVVIENASTGVNSVLRSFNLTDNDGIIYLEFEYPMTKHVIDFVSERYGVGLHIVDIHLPTTAEAILDAVRAEMDKGGVTFCVFDHITSVPAIILPIKELTDLCHERGYPIMIDGAHAIGAVDLDMKDLDADFYISNVHKWLLGLPGTAVMYVKRQWQHLIYPAIISTTYEPFLNRFQWQGTRDTSPWMSIKAALDFRQELTDEAVYEYNNGLCKRVAETLSESWKTSPPVPYEMMATLINVEIPCNVPEPECYDWGVGVVTNELAAKNIWTVIYQIADKRYFRLSCQIYNEFDEYMHLKKEFESIVGL